MNRTDSISLSVSSNKIESVSFSAEFYINGINIIGKSFVNVCELIKEKYGNKKSTYSNDDPVEYDDGDIHVDKNFNQLHMFLTVNNEGIVQQVCVFQDFE